MQSTSEPYRLLKERHKLKHKAHELTVKTGDVVLIKGDEKNRGKWKMGIVKQIIPGRDGKVGAVKLKTGKGERNEQLSTCTLWSWLVTWRNQRRNLNWMPKFLTFVPKERLLKRPKTG